MYCPNGEECLYNHIDPLTHPSKLQICRYYERGFCPLGPRCAKRHVKKEKICKYWMAGFCPYGNDNGRKDGKGCKEGAGAHPRWYDEENSERDRKELGELRVKVERTEEELERERERLREEGEREEERGGGRRGRFGGGGGGGRKYGR